MAQAESIIPDYIRAAIASFRECSDKITAVMLTEGSPASVVALVDLAIARWIQIVAHAITEKNYLDSGRLEGTTIQDVAFDMLNTRYFELQEVGIASQLLEVLLTRFWDTLSLFALFRSGKLFEVKRAAVGKVLSERNFLRATSKNFSVST